MIRNSIAMILAALCLAGASSGSPVALNAVTSPPPSIEVITVANLVALPLGDNRSGGICSLMTSSAFDPDFAACIPIEGSNSGLTWLLRLSA